MVNCERVQKSHNVPAKLRLFSVKLCFKQTDEHTQLTFNFVSEVTCKIDQNFATKSEIPKPSYLCTYFNRGSKRFYVYAGVGHSCTVFSRSLTEVGDTSPLLQHVQQPEKQASLDVDEFLK
jgi:hypothetical protein